MKDRILVTGATGTVGSEAVKALTSAEVVVRAGVHSLIKGDRFRALPDVEIVHLDFADPESLRVALTGVSKVMLITPFSQHQLEEAKKVIDVAKETGVRHVVRLSASGAGAEPGITLGRWHREAEAYLEASGIAYTHLRPTMFMQNFCQTAVESVNNHNSIYMPLGNGRVAYVDVRDVAAVARVVLTQPGYENQVLEITGPEAVTVNDVAHALTQATDRMITYVDVPEEAAIATMRSKQVPEWMIQALMELYEVVKAGHADQVTDTVTRLTGTPARNIFDFAEDNSACFQPD